MITVSYTHLVANSVIDIEKFNDQDASDTEKNLYAKFQQKQQEVFDTITNRLTGDNQMCIRDRCSGGVATDEINPSTLESRLHRGLYFAGELLDIDGACGGYNLQWAWSSGACLLYTSRCV